MAILEKLLLTLVATLEFSKYIVIGFIVLMFIQLISYRVFKFNIYKTVLKKFMEV